MDEKTSEQLKALLNEVELKTGELKDFKKAPKYDPSKKYRWEPGSNFLVLGDEFGVILNSLRIILNTPEARTILLAQKAHEAVEKIISRGVASGIVNEEIEEKSKK